MNTREIDHRHAGAILAYHSIDDSGSVLSTSPQVFTDQMRILSELDADIVSIKEIARQRNGSDGTKPEIAITFDDGFRNVYEHGLPVLRHYGFPATVFLVTDYCGGMNSWPGQPPGIIRKPLLSWNQIKQMSHCGIDFGSHTRTHPHLTAIPTHKAEEEIVSSKRAIEDALGVAVDTFAYPYGAYHEGIKELARTHFALACSTSLGFIHPGSDYFALERLDMYYLRRPFLLRRLFSREIGTYLRLRQMIRDRRQRLAGQFYKPTSEQ